jgi:pimeloyl-ACP methyl ester carboxylesterase
MGPENVEEFALARKGGLEYEARMAEYGDSFAAATKDDVVALFGELLQSGPDKAALEPEARRAQFAASMQQGFELGWRGFYDDDRAFLKEWGFDPTAISVPVAVWFGDHDRSVPRSHGEWLTQNLPTASEHFFGGDGHVSLFTNHFDELSMAIKGTYE